MKQIDVKQPKYILPILVLPFILGIGWVLMDMFKSKPETEAIVMAETQDFNLDIPEANLEKKEVKTKLDALKDAYKKESDYSSLQAIERDEEIDEINDLGSIYSEDEIKALDSLNRATREAEKSIERTRRSYRSSYGEPDRTTDRAAPAKSKMQEEMELFKMQMNYLDSLQNSSYEKENSQQKPRQNIPLKPEEQAAEVLKASNPAGKFFNTVGAQQKTNLITAILDENIKVVQGSRIRIRLLDDILINDFILKKGSYIYGNVSGFTEQRVKIKVSSIMIDGERMKVELSVFDNDGQEGFYVPSSNFRDLTKNIGARVGSQSIQIGDQADGIEKFAYGALNDIYRSTTQAVTKNIKKNKAKLKYNTQVFLVNNKEKE